MGKKYKWSNPYEWLVEKIKNTDDINEVKSICFELLNGMDMDNIQDKFQSEMQNDGYFEKE